MKSGVFLLVLVQFAAADTKTIRDQAISVAADGVVDNHQYFIDGTSHTERSVTNYIIVEDHSTHGHILLTIFCQERRIRDRCFALRKGDHLEGRFEYHTSVHKRDSVSIVGQPLGNLTTPMTMKSTIVDFKDLRDAK